MSEINYKIIHLSSVHLRYDTRIFIKMCQSLAKKNYDVYLVVGDGRGNENKDNISIIDVGLNKANRLSRMTKTVNQI